MNENTSPGLLLSDITTRPLHWLWPQRIPFSHLTILYGQPGSGLSLVALHFAACVSSGRTLPDGLPCPQGNVILIAPFDIPAHTIKPRLENAAADISHILLLDTISVPASTPTTPDFIPESNSSLFSNPPFSNLPSFSSPSTGSSHSSASTSEQPFSLSHDLAHLENAIQRTSARLVIIDSPDICRDNLMRSLLPRLTHLAQHTGCAILLIRPLTRTLPTSLRPAFLNTLPLISAVHSAFLLIHDPDPEEDEARLLITIKHSLSTPTPTLCCDISPQPSGIPTIQWLGEYTGSVISSPSSEATESPRSLLRQFILDSLHASPEPITAQQLSQFALFSHDNIRKTLQRMTQSGELISPARGLYTIPPSPTNTSVPTVPTVPTVAN